MTPQTKLFRTIQSCKTTAHCDTAKNLIRNYELLYGCDDYAVIARTELKRLRNGLAQEV